MLLNCVFLKEKGFFSRHWLMSNVSDLEVHECLDFVRRYSEGVDTTPRRSYIDSSAHHINHYNAPMTPQFSFRNQGGSSPPLEPVQYVYVPQHPSFPPIMEPVEPAPAPGDDRRRILEIVWWLRCRYAANITTEVSRSPLDVLKEDEVNGLLNCFGQEIISVMHKQMQLTLQDTSGGSERRVNFKPQFEYRPVNSNPNSNRDPVPHSSVNGTQQGRTKSSERRSEAVDLSKMSLRDCFILLRKGEYTTKFNSKKGRPDTRFLRIADRHILFNGDMTSMPHLCWSVAAHEEPTGEHPLIHLVGITDGPAHGCQRDREGIIRDAVHQVISESCCLSLVFQERSVDLGFLKKETHDLWLHAFQMVLEKNKKAVR